MSDETNGGCGGDGCGCGGGGATATAERPGLPIVAAGTPVRAGVPAEPGDLDARTLAPAQRRATILATVTALLPGEAFVLANDHDPARLRTELREVPGEIAWEYLAQGPDLWRVRISRTAGC
jgi:uncharacterized protein (DUF2249 family)